MSTKKKLHEIMGLTHSAVSKWKTGRTEMRAAHAKKLEQLTGINRLRFLYPDEFGDPWREVKEIMEPKK